MFHLAYFTNSLYNGSTLGVDRSVKTSPLGFNVQTSTRYVELSTSIRDGMYNLNDYIYPFFHRQSLYGYALPSQDEWIKSAYYLPHNQHSLARQWWAVAVNPQPQLEGHLPYQRTQSIPDIYEAQVIYS